jgi:hypothetical protein
MLSYTYDQVIRPTENANQSAMTITHALLTCMVTHRTNVSMFQMLFVTKIKYAIQLMANVMAFSEVAMEEISSASLNFPHHVIQAMK